VSEIFTLRNGDDSSDDRPRLVLDTNTVLALWMFRDPKLEALRAWIEAGNCLLLSREDALEELRRVLAYRQFGLDEDFQDALLDEYRTRLAPRTAERNNKNPDNAGALPRCSDPDDQKFLQIALQSAATHLLTRDKALSKLARHAAIRDRFRILTPERFAATSPRLVQEAH
jgi:predicted nucleic acid-binding protein